VTIPPVSHLVRACSGTGQYFQEHFPRFAAAVWTWAGRNAELRQALESFYTASAHVDEAEAAGPEPALVGTTSGGWPSLRSDDSSTKISSAATGGSADEDEAPRKKAASAEKKRRKAAGKESGAVNGGRREAPGAELNEAESMAAAAAEVQAKAAAQADAVAAKAAAEVEAAAAAAEAEAQAQAEVTAAKKAQRSEERNQKAAAKKKEKALKRQKKADEAAKVRLFPRLDPDRSPGPILRSPRLRFTTLFAAREPYYTRFSRITRDEARTENHI
jgi:hypothetical protein